MIDEDLAPKTLIIDIGMADLIELENQLYIHGIMSYSNELYIRSCIHPVDGETFYNLKDNYPTLCRIGRNFYPTKAFDLLQLVLNNYQFENSSCSSIIKRDPAGIDNNNLLDNDLDKNDLLISSLSKLGSGINEGFVYAFKNRNTRIPDEEVENIFHKLNVIDDILQKLEFLAKENIFPHLVKLKKGMLYKIELNKSGVFLKEMGDVIHLRYKNIIEINRIKTKESFYRQMDEEEAEEERDETILD